jgi:FkbM family methyltransferase
VSNKRLALAIPTFRRSRMVEDNLTRIVDELKELDIAVYLSDDSPDQETELVVGMLQYGNFHYRRNSPALGHDSNVLMTLLWPEEEYVWLLGDSVRPRPGQLKKILGFLSEQDLIFVNSHHPETLKSVPFADGEAARTLVRDLLWHQALTGATIYHRRVRTWVKTSNLEVKTNFPQLSVIMGYASSNPVSVSWFEEKSIEATFLKKQSYWHRDALNVFVDDWVSLIRAHPILVPPDRRAAILKSHSAKTYLFEMPFLAELKQGGQFGWASTKRPNFWDVMHLSRLRILSVLLFPKWVILAMSLLTHYVTQLRDRGPSAIFWSRLRSYKKRISDNPKVGRMVEIFGNKVWLDGMTLSLDNPLIPTAFKGHILFGFYEKAERTLVAAYIDRKLPTIEIGGAIGAVSCTIGKLLVNPQAFVVVECSPTNLASLAKNRELNACQFSIESKAVAYGSDTISFSVDTFYAGRIDANGAKTISVPTTSIREILKKYRFDDSINLIADCEGSEIDIVANEIETLRDRVKWLIIEVHPALVGQPAVDAMMDKLEEAGFIVRDRSLHNHHVFALENENL